MTRGRGFKALKCVLPEDAVSLRLRLFLSYIIINAGALEQENANLEIRLYLCEVINGTLT